MVTNIIPESCNNQQGEISIKGEGVHQPYSYQWVSPNNTDSLITGLTTGDYKLKITNQLGCEVDTTIYLGQINVPPSGFTESTVCIGEQTNFVFDSVQNNTICRWVFKQIDTVFANCGNIPFTYQDTGLQEVTHLVTDQYGCTGITKHNIEVYPKPVASFTDSIEFSTTGVEQVFLSNLSDTLNSSIWSFGDGSTSTVYSPTHQYNEAGGYAVQLITLNEFGCKDTAIKSFMIKDKYSIPITNVISPNDDGYNDQLELNFDVANCNLKIWVYDRWGLLKYKDPCYKNNWDGRNLRGKLVNTDTYYYIIRIDNRRVYTGWVYVVNSNNNN